MSQGEQYTVTESQKSQFAAIYLLEYMINAPKTFALMLEREEEDLEPILEVLMVRDLIEIKDEEQYIPTEKGRKALQRFMKRYSDFLTFFDVFCAVDLGEGAFAFANYFEYDSKEAWFSFLNQDNWEDLRVAVAAYKGIDPVEIVFMSFINEERFGRNETGWTFDLLLGTVWDEILHICNSALKIEQLGWEDEDGQISGEAVMEDILAQGLALAEELHQREDNPYREITHSTSDKPSERTLEAVDILKRDANSFDPTPEKPDHWKEPWEL
ncbi:hypothetical protein MLD52_03670 [Puniceicoccaceae bacterium K14]|nr:hypothetical protein [Puniceicoccaceae bacterium K14]